MHRWRIPIAEDRFQLAFWPLLFLIIQVENKILLTWQELIFGQRCFCKPPSSLSCGHHGHMRDEVHFWRQILHLIFLPKAMRRAHTWKDTFMSHFKHSAKQWLQSQCLEWDQGCVNSLFAKGTLLQTSKSHTLSVQFLESDAELFWFLPVTRNRLYPFYVKNIFKK